MANVNGPPVGNRNTAKTKPWADAIRRAIAQSEDRALLDKLAKKLLQKVAEGESWATKEMGDRLDGRPIQQTEVSGPDGGPLEFADNLSAAERLIKLREEMNRMRTDPAVREFLEGKE